MNEVATTEHITAALQEKALLGGDLSKLTPGERLSYYNSVCTSLGLNPLTRPFDYITLNGKLTLYARKDCTEQLRTKRGISINILSRELVEGVFIVTAQATEPGGRTDESIGAVPLANLQGENKANAMMKAETKAKRRVTLSICGLGMLDETEIESIQATKQKDTRTLKEKVQAKLVTVQPSVEQKLEKMADEISESMMALPAKERQERVEAASKVVEEVTDKAANAPIIWNAGKTPEQDKVNGHRGKDIRKVPADYLIYYEKSGPQDEYRQKATAELNRRDEEKLFSEERT